MWRLSGGLCQTSTRLNTPASGPGVAIYNQALLDAAGASDWYVRINTTQYLTLYIPSGSGPKWTTTATYYADVRVKAIEQGSSGAAASVVSDVYSIRRYTGSACH